MPKFIKLHLWDGGSPLLVQVAAIQAVVPMRAHALIVIGPEQHTEVQETVVAIEKLLADGA